MESTEFRSLRSSEILRLRRLLQLSAGERRQRIASRLKHLEAREAALIAQVRLPTAAAQGSPAR